MAIYLKDELESLGYPDGPEKFRELILDTFAEVYHGTVSSDELVVNPREAIRFVGFVKSRSGLSDATEPLILRTLLNSRKRAMKID